MKSNHKIIGYDFIDKVYISRSRCGILTKCAPLASHKDLAEQKPPAEKRPQKPF